MAKIIAFKQEEFAGCLCQGIGEAVAKIQAGRVSGALAKIAICFACYLCLPLGDGRYYQLGLANKIVEAPPSDWIST